MTDVAQDAEKRAQVEIHPSAEVHEDAELGVGVVVGPWSRIGANVEIGDRTEIGSHVLLEKDTTVGAECEIHHGAVLGTDPQDMKYDGEETVLKVGDRTTIREYATLNRGTDWSHETVVGDDCLLMAYVHVAHDCHLGNHVTISNATNMAGHVFIEEWAILSGLIAVHQFVKIGAHSFIGGGSRVPQDVPPYCRVVGNPSPKLYGLNSVGLERRGFSDGTRKALKTAYRLVFNSSLSQSEALEKVENEVESTPEVRHFLDFIRSSERGVVS